MTTNTITCPSGLVLEIRGFKTREANILADAEAMKKGTGYDQILSQCTVSVIDPGVYTFSGKKSPIERDEWQKVLSGDRLFTMVKIRTLAFGDDYAFNVHCPLCESKKPIEWELKLSDLPVKPYPEETIAALKEHGNRFPAEFSDGTKFWFKIPDGALETGAANVQRTKRALTVSSSLALRIIEVEGVEPKKLHAFMLDLDMNELPNLKPVFDEPDGGVETAIQVSCGECGGEPEVELPFAREFYLPTPKKVSPDTV